MERDLDALFNSSSVKDVLKFYENFDTSRELINWMKKRPKQAPDTYVYERNTDIIVVIPTIDHLGERAENCVNKIFEDLTVILVESGVSKFFNYSRSVNYGLKEAIRYNPEWILVSNDDVLKKDPSSKLRASLKNIINEETKIVFTRPEGKYHSVQHSICKRRLWSDCINEPIYYLNAISKFEKKFGIIWNHSPTKIPFTLFYKEFHNFLLTASFSIFSGWYIKETKGNLFDETYINGVEDIDLSYSLTRSSNNYSFADFSIDEEVGSSLGNDKVRKIRDIANLAYFNYKIKSGEIQIR